MARTVVTYDAGVLDASGAAIQSPTPDATKFLDGTGSYSVPGVTGGTPATTAGVLLYDYVVTGSDKASIDTQVDDGGNGAAALPTGYHLMEIWLYARTDDAVTFSDVGLVMNNDTGGNYDRQRLRAAAGVVTGATQVAGTSGVQVSVCGASMGANRFSSATISIVNYGNTSNFKSGQFLSQAVDSVGANDVVDFVGFVYRSTSAVSRLSIASTVGGKKLKVGSRLTVWAR